MSSQRQSFPGLIFSLIVGMVYIVLTLPKGTLRIANQQGWGWLADFAQWGISVNQSISQNVPTFPELMLYMFYATAIYLGSLLLLALRHGRLGFFGWGLFALVISTAVFHLIAWGGYIAIIVIRFVFWLIGIITAFLAGLVEPIIRFLQNLAASILEFLYQLLQPLLGGLWWLGAGLLLFVLAFIIFKFWNSFMEAFKLAVRLVIGLAVVIGGIYLLNLLWQVIGPFVLMVLNFLSEVLSFIIRVLLFVAIGLGILVAIATVGQLLLDQLKGALNAGNRRLGVIIGAIAIGTSLAILLLVSNLYSIASWLPYEVMQFVSDNLYQQAPTLDALIALAVLALSVIGVLRNIPYLLAEPTPEDFGKSLVYSVLGVFVAGALTAISGQTEE